MYRKYLTLLWEEVFKIKKLLNNIGVKVSFLTIIINFLLFVLKLVVGLFAHSKAIVSDAFHSLSDVISTIIVIIGLVISNKEADSGHPYGHEKIESIFAIILSFILLLSGLSIGYIGLSDIMSNKELVIPGSSALVVAVISILVKEGMFHYTMHTAKKINSSSMKADAWHHRSDALSSVASFVSVGLAKLGYPIFDPICSLLIAILIVKTAIEIFIDATNRMVDKACDDDLKEQIEKTILEGHPDIKINDFKTRMFGSRCYIDVEIAMNGDISLKESNAIAVSIHNKVENKFSIIKHCNIHVIPFE